MAAANSNRSIGFLKRAWHENPEILGSAILAVVGLGMSGYAVKHYNDIDGDNRKYKASYTVYRHDDPRVPKLKTQCDTTGL